MKQQWIKEALRIRRVEETFLDLFSRGMLNGTVHTCIGQEFSALAFAGGLAAGDAVISNHRCHGHYLAFTGDMAGLVAELTGKGTGTCGGVGSSQHLCRDGFLSNGIQGGMVPVAAGLAMARKLRDDRSIVVVFLGDGTLGQGVIYEAMNMAALWCLPLLMVCERNGYAQSTPTDATTAGSITGRAEAFGITAFHDSTADPARLMESARRSVALVRANRCPVFHLVDTHRLAPHSKGDDHRDPALLAACRAEDPLCRFALEEPDTFARLLSEVDCEVADCLAAAEMAPELTLEDYLSGPASPARGATAPIDPVSRAWIPVAPSSRRMADMLHDALAARLAADPSTLLLGEDIAAPYGGAFKVTRDLSERFPAQVVSTPISEAGITGVANGLALDGFRPVVEIMFGDFVTLTLDQLINHGSKFRHMYNGQARCPLVLRTPMGGGRGYGPTHSQSLEKFLAGIDNVTLAATNSLVDPALVYEQVFALDDPAVVVEHKLDYGRRVAARTVPGFVIERTAHGWPVVRVRPRVSHPHVTVVAFGGMADTVMAGLEKLFTGHGIKAEVVIPTRLCPLDMGPVLDSVSATGRLVIVEEGSGFAGIGAEIAARAAESDISPRIRRLCAAPVPIPSVRSLEDQVLPSSRSIITSISEFMQ